MMYCKVDKTIIMAAIIIYRLKSSDSRLNHSVTGKCRCAVHEATYYLPSVCECACPLHNRTDLNNNEVLN